MGDSRGLFFGLTVIIYVFLVSGMLVQHGEKGVLFGADVMFLIIHIALKLLMFQLLDSAHTMFLQIPTCYEGTHYSGD